MLQEVHSWLYLRLADPSAGSQLLLLANLVTKCWPDLAFLRVQTSRLPDVASHGRSPIAVEGIAQLVPNELGCYKTKNDPQDITPVLLACQWLFIHDQNNMTRPDWSLTASLPFQLDCCENLYHQPTANKVPSSMSLQQVELLPPAGKPTSQDHGH